MGFLRLRYGRYVQAIANIMSAPQSQPFTTTSPASLASLATGRQKELFHVDIQAFHQELRERIAGRRILIIGGAGSIGKATAHALIPFSPRALHIVDQNENTLVELIRDFRSCFSSGELPELHALPLNFGSPIMQRYLYEQPSFDYVLNFAALKHVRSEKDAYSILQMLDTNVLKPINLLKWVIARGGTERYFSVSTDKAANPVNLMGASKRLMEHVIFSPELSNNSSIHVSSARFANVAFSDGSLLHGWLNRLANSQPVAVPRDTRRYFVSLIEAGQICLLAAFLAPDRHVLAPKLSPASDLVDLAGVATKVLQHFGFEPEFFDDEAKARHAASLPRNGFYPLLLTPLDTSGEKPFEEFVAADEKAVDIGMLNLIGIPYKAAPPDLLRRLVLHLEMLGSRWDARVDKDALVQQIAAVLPEFNHVSSSKTLDQRL